MTKAKRDLHYVEPKLRSCITARIFFYWTACVVFSTLPLIIGTTLVNSDRLFVDHLGVLFQRYWPLYLMILGILPFAIKDVMRVTNRTLGPLDRLRREMARFRQTGQYSPIKCRNDDFLCEFIEEINDTMVCKAAAEVPRELSETIS